MILFLVLAAAKASTYIEPVFWNVDNPSFQSNYSRHVQLQQKMDIFCPQRISAQSLDQIQKTISDDYHFQEIYMVDQGGFENCHVDKNVHKKLMTCRRPETEKKYTIIFQEVNPNPFGFEFEPERAYYLISTSHGQNHEGLTNSHWGVCNSHNMRLKLDVHHGDVANRGVQKMEKKVPEDIKLNEIYYQMQKDTFRQKEVQREDRHVFNNFLIIGVVLGVILVLMILLVAFLTRRSFQKRDKNLSCPTLSDYQSSYGSYDYPQSLRDSVVKPICNAMSENDLKVDVKPVFQQQNSICHPIINGEHYKHYQIQPKVYKIDEFSYYEGRGMKKSNRSSDVLII